MLLRTNLPAPRTELDKMRSMIEKLGQEFEVLQGIDLSTERRNAYVAFRHMLETIEPRIAELQLDSDRHPSPKPD